MIVDSSAIIAMLLNEPETAIFSGLISGAEDPKLSTGSLIELSVVVQRRRIVAPETLDALLPTLGIAVAPVTVEQALLARDGFRRFGQGSGHRARLNVGDCFAYALAKATGEPLLFKGDDFIHTDIIPAL